MAEALKQTAPPDTEDHERIFLEREDELRMAERFETAAQRVISGLSSEQFPELKRKPLARREGATKQVLNVLLRDEDFPIRGDCDRCDGCVRDPENYHPHP